MNLKDVELKLKRKNKILFSRESECFQELLEHIRMQNHRTLVLWALECVKEPVKILKQRYPDDTRPERALELSRDWARGVIKMPVAKKAILNVHAAAKDIINPVDVALFHSVGQGYSTVHVETHAIGLPIYELTAIVYELGYENCEKAIIEKINNYINCLKQCEYMIKNDNNWADFLMDDSRTNKERTLCEKSGGC